MKIFMAKFDNPLNKYEWLTKEVEITSMDNIDVIMGICATNSYAEIISVSESDNPEFVKQIKMVLDNLYPTPAWRIIEYLSSKLKRIVDYENMEKL